MEVVVASAEVSRMSRIADKLAAVELKLKEKLGANARLLPTDVGPHRAVNTSREQPWQALTSRQTTKLDGTMGYLPDRVEWGDQELSRTQVKVATQLEWGLELVMTVPHEIKRLANETDWKKITHVWDPWDGTRVINKVMLLEWPHSEIMNNDWNPHLKWLRALNAMQPGNYRAWKQRYGV
ncbi:hypothetical protein CYMTET_5392 [Cymbomonas tetramitiformis]|uniref:Uncharacterized protein n=1 Tax=Cymbomonas tetramitiformis TaxID=36881 RepID=A0AAE0GZF1_9CHLO|nr:hypothetical protein CYMTET_5392 [Cymbomonas tetramitiformis]